ncbi:hypothetical protein HDU93_000987 [Gonapodya sp. JEL0774]|nr:hypothetical protein HDU93_000987 [Gonapodya sp. JEL0774]
MEPALPLAPALSGVGSLGVLIDALLEPAIADIEFADREFRIGVLAVTMGVLGVEGARESEGCIVAKDGKAGDEEVPDADLEPEWDDEWLDWETEVEPDPDPMRASARNEDMTLDEPQ